MAKLKAKVNSQTKEQDNKESNLNSSNANEEKSWFDEVISEQEQDLYEEDNLMNKIPKSAVGHYRSDDDFEW